MAKEKTSFHCSTCNYQTVKWLGCCPECHEWNSFVEHKAAAHSKSVLARPVASTKPISLHNIPQQTSTRITSGIQEWDRLMGGGIMPSSFIIITGDPGIGKSTLLLQICNQLARQQTIFYFSTEESLSQVKSRADRLGCINDTLLFSDETNLNSILSMAQDHKPDMVIIDSIQNCNVGDSQSAPGSTSQLREIAFALMRLAKENNITVIVSGHITKDGNIAGPKTLEHMVDAVFYLQGEDRWQTRVLRSVKNRFGTINELGFFEMKESGLTEVPNINEYLLSGLSCTPGSALIGSIEGSRPLLLELQALTIASKLTMPQRVISGVDHKQVILIAAILEKYLQVKLSTQDIFVKVSGGFKVHESGSDLGIALALLSSYFQQPLPEKSIALAEISLTGQIKPINQINMFTREAEKFGITTIFAAENQKIEHSGCAIKRFKNVYELLSLFN